MDVDSENLSSPEKRYGFKSKLKHQHAESELRVKVSPLLQSMDWCFIIVNTAAIL
jgi:hypothetical protein